MAGEAHHGKKRGTFVQRTIDGLAETMERSLYAEQLSEQRGMLQLLDPRVKFIGTLSIIMVAATARRLDVIIGVALCAVVLAIWSRVPLRAFVNIWIGMAVFSGMIVATLVGLILIPSMYVLIDRFGGSKKKSGEDGQPSEPSTH